MTPADIGAVLGDNWLFVLALVFFLSFVTTKLLETSKAAADLAGPLGRWVQKRKDLRADRHKKELREQARDLLADSDIADMLQPPDYEELKTQVTRCTDELRDSRMERAALRSFVVYDEEWHFRDHLDAVDDERKPAARLAWDEFYEKYRQGWRPDGQ